jgi:hypothetical protein
MASCMNKRNINLALQLTVIFLLLAFSGCKTKRAIIKAPLKTKGEVYLLEKMEGAETKFDYFSARCNITVITDRKSKTEFRGQVRIQKDSVIWVSLSPALGIEAARLLITPDSVKFINRFDKTYFNDDYTFINSFFTSTIDFDIFQALFTGNDLSWYDDDNFRASIDAMEYRLSATNRTKRKRYLKQKDTPNMLVQNIWLDPESFKIVKLSLKEFGDENKRLQAEYSNFQTINGQMIPASLTFEVHSGQKTIVQVEYSRIETGVPQVFPFKIPENFSKMK